MKRRWMPSTSAKRASSRSPRGVSRVEPPPRPPVLRATSGSPATRFMVSIASQAAL